MKKTRRNYTREFKREAVRLLETSGKSAAQIERESRYRRRLPLALETRVLSQR